MARILVAEDSPTDLTFIREILKGVPHEIIFARDGEEAEKMARTQSPDLLILDVVMPGKNGFQVCRDLKKDEKFKNIPIIMTTSKSGDSDRFWGKKQGADEYITKPYEPRELLQAVKRYLP